MHPPFCLRLSMLLSVTVPLLLLAVVFSACTSSDRFSAGEAMGREDLVSISAAIFPPEPLEPSETDSETDPEMFAVTEPETLPPDLYPPWTVFWTEDETMYHMTPLCPRLKGSSFDFGTLTEATAHGKSRVCSHCVPPETEHNRTPED